MVNKKEKLRLLQCGDVPEDVARELSLLIHADDVGHPHDPQNPMGNIVEYFKKIHEANYGLWADLVKGYADAASHQTSQFLRQYFGFFDDCHETLVRHDQEERRRTERKAA